MHSLALSILRRGNQLGQYPSDPVVLDGWEQKHVYDAELADVLGSTPTRAKVIREAHDAGWHTLNPTAMAQAQITQAEKQRFDAFHTNRTNLYSCVLPGEIIYKPASPCSSPKRIGGTRSRPPCCVARWSFGAADPVRGRAHLCRLRRRLLDRRIKSSMQQVPARKNLGLGTSTVARHVVSPLPLRTGVVPHAAWPLIC